MISIQLLNLNSSQRGNWRFRESPRSNDCPAAQIDWLPANVPGCIHIDLMQNNLLADPFYASQERSALWVDETDWEYECQFTIKSDEAPGTCFLRFEGLDTIAEITLNGEIIGNTDNMYIPHEFQVTSMLRRGNDEAGHNILHIKFRSPLQAGRERKAKWVEEGNDASKPNPLDWFVWGPRSFIRKAQYMFGWDWGPELASAGIWQPVQLFSVPIARLAGWNYRIRTLSAETAVVNWNIDVERMEKHETDPLSVQFNLAKDGDFFSFQSARPLEMPTEDTPNKFQKLLSVMTPDKMLSQSVPVPEGEGVVNISFEITIPNPELWWPNGLGEQNLYGLMFTLRSGQVGIDKSVGHIGLRTIQLVTKLEDGSETFLFRVNGKDVFIKGANWIPVDSFPARLYQDDGFIDNSAHQMVKQMHLIQLAKDAHLNMLRIWGGGLYESELFYKQCDRLGILVWQDFAYACAYYPDTGKYAEDARAEALAAIKRLRTHPSLALWCGGNENHQMYYDGWGGGENRPPRFLGENIYHKILAEAAAEEDPDTPYWPGSPYGGENPNSPDIGDRHDWEVWGGREDWVKYSSDDSLFVSEFGFASSCGKKAWKSCLPSDQMHPQSSGVKSHDKTRIGYDNYLNFTAIHFPFPMTMENLIYYTQLNQAEAMQYGIEHWRRSNRCRGVIFWQWDDCWPVQSWSVIDYAQEPKAAYYFIKRSYEPLLLSLHRVGNTIEAHLVNELDFPSHGTLALTLQTFDGRNMLQQISTLSVPAGGSQKAGALSLGKTKGREKEMFVHALYTREQGTQLEKFLFLAEPKDLLLPDPGLQVKVEQLTETRVEVQLKTEKFAPYIWLRLDHPEKSVFNKRELIFSDNFFHLRPLQEKTVFLETNWMKISAQQISQALRVRSY